MLWVLHADGPGVACVPQDGKCLVARGMVVLQGCLTIDWQCNTVASTHSDLIHVPA